MSVNLSPRRSFLKIKSVLGDDKKIMPKNTIPERIIPGSSNNLIFKELTS